MSSQIIIKIIGLIYKIYLTNKEGFGDEGNAIYNSGFQIYALFLTIISIGIPNSISKIVSSKIALGNEKSAYKTLKVAFALFGIAGFLGSTILFWGANTIADKYLQIEGAENILRVLSPSIFLVSITCVLKGYFNGREEIKITATSANIEQILKTIFTMLIVELIARKSFNNTSLMVGGAALASTIATLISLIYLHKYFNKRKKDVWKKIRKTIYKEEKNKEIISNILKVFMPITISNLFSGTNKTIDAMTIVRILKRQIGEKEAILQYGILSGKIDTLISLPFAFNIACATALIPTVASAISKKDKKIAEDKINFSLCISLLIGILSSTFMIIFAKQIISILFPKAINGINMLKVSSIDIILVTLIQTINGTMQGLDKTNIMIIAFGVGSITKIVLNIILLSIPSLGINGAIISNLISHLIVYIICYNYLRKNIKISIEFKKYLHLRAKEMCECNKK